MNRNKKIDDLFKENVPRSEETPPNDVWEKIDARLTQNRKKKIFVLPLWYKIAGVAALVILIFTLAQRAGQPIFDSPSITHEPVDNNQSKREVFSEEEVSDGNTGAESKPSEVPGTADAETKLKAERNSNGVIPSSTAIQVIKKDRPKVESLQIALRAKKRDAYIFLPAGNISDFGIPETQISALHEFEKRTEPEAENPDKKALQKGFFEDNFSISPTIAAVYFGKLGGGNALDEKFADNSNTGEVTIAYGFSLAYKLSDKIRIRSGLNNVSLSSKTQNVMNSHAGSATAIEGNPAGNTQFSPGYGTLNQQLDFLEIPLELEYTLVEKEMGVSLIAGASTFFLQENEVSLTSVESSQSLGPANNLNQTSFSANLGIGLKYFLFSQFELNLNPIFKYQLNTYEDVSNLKPYHFGIYSGIRFKF